MRCILTPYGRVSYYELEGIILINRHGMGKSIPPHKINYKANIFGLRKLGVRYVFAFNSTGSLKAKIKPGSFVVPDDYIEFNPLTFFDRERRHITPEISSAVRDILIKALRKARVKFHPRGVYFESRGPRLETKAEINFIKDYADVVGMTMGKEATLAKELGLEYASVCSVDNYANGIVKVPLSQEKIEENYHRNNKNIDKIIRALTANLIR